MVIKPGVRVKLPWRLEIGDHSWIGEHVWIDNLAAVSIGADCCVSQGVYLCTGSHDWSAPGFDLVLKPIILEDGSWAAAKSVIGPGVRMKTGAVLTLGAVATADLDAWTLYKGAPAAPAGRREVRS